MIKIWSGSLGHETVSNIFLQTDYMLKTLWALSTYWPIYSMHNGQWYSWGTYANKGYSYIFAWDKVMLQTKKQRFSFV